MKQRNHIGTNLYRKGAWTVCALLILSMPWQRWEALYQPTALRAVLAPFLAWAILVFFFLQREDSSGALSQSVKGKPRWGSAGLVALAVFLLWSAASWVWSVDTFAVISQTHSTFLLVLLALGVALTCLMQETGKGVLVCLVSSASLTGALALLCTGLGWAEPHPTGRYSFPFAEPAALAGCMVFPAIVLTLRFFRSVQKRATRVASLELLALCGCLAGVAAAGARASIIAIGVGLLLGTYLSQVAWRRWILAGLVLTIGLGTVLVCKSSTPLERREWLYTGTAGTRLLFGWAAVRLAAEKPVLGWGAGAYPREAPLVEEKTSFLHGQRGDYTGSAHSEPLQILCETGLIGLGLWLLAHAAVLWGLRKKPILFAGFAGLMVDSVGSMSLRQNELILFYGIYFGYACYEAGLYWPRVGGFAQGICGKKQKAITTCTVVLAASCHIYILLMPELMSQVQLGRAFRYAAGDKIEDAVSNAALAMEHASHFSTWHAATEMNAYLNERGMTYDAALAARGEMLTRLPGEPVNRRALANLLYRRGKWQEALSLVIQGLQINPYKPLLHRELTRQLRGLSLAQLLSWKMKTFPGADTRAPLLTEADREYLVCRLLWEADNRSEAIAKLRALDQRMVQIGVTQLYLIRWQWQTGYQEDAREAALAAIVDYPIDPRILAAAADILSQDEEDAVVERGYSCIRQAEGLGRNLPEVVEVAARLYTAAGWYDDLERITARALSEDRSNPRLWIIRIEALQRIGRQEQAAALAKEARRAFPKEPHLHKVLGANSENQ